MNYNAGWGAGGGYPPQMYYPPMNEVRFIPVPNGSNSEAIQILKKELKDLKKKGSEPKKEEKKEDKKPGAITYLQQVAVIFAVSPFIILCNALIILFIIRAFKGL